jgi:hypothetical protein
MARCLETESMHATTKLLASDVVARIHVLGRPEAGSWTSYLSTVRLWLGPWYPIGMIIFCFVSYHSESEELFRDIKTQEVVIEGQFTQISNRPRLGITSHK